MLGGVDNWAGAPGMTHKSVEKMVLKMRKANVLVRRAACAEVLKSPQKVAHMKPNRTDRPRHLRC